MSVFVRTATAPVVITVAFSACATGTAPDLGDDDAKVDAGTVYDSGSHLSPDSAAPWDSSTPVDAGDAGDACAEALAKISFDFESGAQGFTHGNSDGVTGSWPFDPWSQGNATIGTPCKAGKCFGAERTANYAQCHRGYLLSPAIDLSACKGRTVALVFQHAYAYWTDGTWFDGGVVEVSGDGTTWTLPQGTFSGTVNIRTGLSGYNCISTPFGASGKSGFTGTQTATVRAELTLPAAAITSTTRVRFSSAAGVSSMTTDADTSRSATDFGWRIDDVAFVVK